MLLSANSVAELPLSLAGSRFDSDNFVKKDLFPWRVFKEQTTLLLQKFRAVT